MIVALPPKQPGELTGRERLGKEQRAQLTGEPDARVHGALTGQLLEILARAEPDRASLDDLDRALKEVFEQGVSVKLAGADRSQPLLANILLHARASELLARLLAQPTRDIIDDLAAVIARREQQGDYWPEGRLNLGIAYACLEEYEDARRWLEDAVNMLEYPSYIPRSQQMAA